MKLDAKAIRYLTSEDFRVLSAVLITPSTRRCPNHRLRYAIRQANMDF